MNNETNTNTAIDIEAANAICPPAPKTLHERVRAMFDNKVTKSEIIRTLHAEGATRSAINKAFEIAGIKMRYQHVRNVLIQEAKKDGLK